MIRECQIREPKQVTPQIPKCCLAYKTKAAIVKCFNSTGFENLLDPVNNGAGIDMFMAGDSEKAKSVDVQL